MSGRAVFEAFEYPLANTRLSAVDACDHVQLGNTQSSRAPLDVLLKSVLPDLGLPPGPELR